MFFVYRFILTWIIWLLFADKKRWRELLPVSIFAALLGQLSDDMFVRFYTLWDYQDPYSDNEKFNDILIHSFDDISVYMVIVYLFLQWLPEKRTFWTMSRYWMLWSIFSICIEWIHLKTGHMSHYNFWNLGYSFLTDLFLFTVFYYFHKMFRLKKLGEE